MYTVQSYSEFCFSLFAEVNTSDAENKNQSFDNYKVIVILSYRFIIIVEFMTTIRKKFCEFKVEKYF